MAETKETKVENTEENAEVKEEVKEEVEVEAKKEKPEPKKERKSKDKTKDIGYKNGLFLNQDVVTEITWTIDKIKNRTDKIVLTLLDMYKW